MVVGLFTVSRKIAVFVITLVAVGLSSASAFAGASAIATTQMTDGTFNEMFERIVLSFGGFTNIASFGAYILALAAAITGIIKLKDAVEDPSRTPIKDVVVRFLLAGALMAMPSVIDLLTATMGGQVDTVEATEVIWSGGGAVAALTCDAGAAMGGLGGALFAGITGGTLGSMVCAASSAFRGLPTLLSVLMYLGAIILVIWSLIQMKDHVIDPRSMPLSAPLKKFLVAGIFFAFPSFLTVVFNTFAGDSVLVGTDIFSVVGAVFGALGAVLGGGAVPCDMAAALGPIGVPLGAVLGGGTVGGLDCMFMRLIGDISGPIQVATSLFCYLAGIIVIIIAVRRLMESTDKGPRGPLGIGTFSLFVLGGILLSFNTFLATVSITVAPSLLAAAGGALGLGTYAVQQSATLSYAPGVSSSGIASMEAILTSMMSFLFLVGMLSVLRGLFILKDVADGGNGSLMAGFTHVIGGGLAINIGPLITAVQNTLGLDTVGLTFS